MLPRDSICARSLDPTKAKKGLPNFKNAQKYDGVGYWAQDHRVF